MDTADVVATPPPDVPVSTSGVGNQIPTPQTAPGAPPSTPAAAAQQPPQQPQQESGLMAILHAVGNALGGGKTNSVVNPQTGAIEQVNKSTGSKIGSAITTLIRGAAAGAAQHGPGSIGRSAEAGEASQEDFQKQQRQILNEQSQNVRETQDAQQKQLLTQASLNKSAQELVRMRLDNQAAGVQMSEHLTDIARQSESIKSLPGAKVLGTFASNDEMDKFLESSGDGVSGQLATDFVHNKLVPIMEPDGKFAVVQLPKPLSEYPAEKGQKVPFAQFGPGKDGKMSVTGVKWVDATPGMTMGDVYQNQVASATSIGNFEKEQADIAGKKAETELRGAQEESARAEAKRNVAEASKAYADTELTKLQAQNESQFLDMTKNGDPFGNTIGAPGMDKKEYNKRVDSFTKDYGKDLSQISQAGAQLQGIISNAEKTGSLPGAASVVGLFDAIGISSAPLKGRGFRINNEIVGEHTGARNVLQSAAVKLQKASPDGTGQVVTLQQLKDYQSILQQAEHDAYLGAADQSRQLGIGTRIVPQGHNTPATADTVHLFLDLAGGDAAKATSALQTSGWQVAP